MTCERAWIPLPSSRRFDLLAPDLRALDRR